VYNEQVTMEGLSRGEDLLPGIESLHSAGMKQTDMNALKQVWMRLMVRRGGDFTRSARISINLTSTCLQPELTTFEAAAKNQHV